MKRISILPLICVSLFGACLRPKAQEAYHKLSAAEAHKMMQEMKEFIILDVRAEAEHREQRIAGSILIPDFEIRERAPREIPEKDKVILVYCRSGRRSESAARVLAGLGYKNIYDFGGIINWPYETVGD